MVNEASAVESKAYRAEVITVSTRAAGGHYQDTAGPAGVEALRAMGFEVAAPIVVSDGEPVGQALTKAIANEVDLVITCGGTGFAPDDQTPEQTRPLLDRPAPGIAEYLRAQTWDRLPAAALSRGVAGVADLTLVINLPGSKTAVVESIEQLSPILIHALDQLAGGDHERID